MENNQHTYYIAAQRKVFGAHKDNTEFIAYLYATYMRIASVDKEPMRVDGVSFFTVKGQPNVRAIIQGENIPVEVRAHTCVSP